MTHRLSGQKQFKLVTDKRSTQAKSSPYIPQVLATSVFIHREDKAMLWIFFQTILSLITADAFFFNICDGDKSPVAGMYIYKQINLYQCIRISLTNVKKKQSYACLVKVDKFNEYKQIYTKEMIVKRCKCCDYRQTSENKRHKSSNIKFRSLSPTFAVNDSMS